MTDGFSCRSQIAHGSDRGALHLAQVIQMALHEGPNGPSTTHPEQRYAEDRAAAGAVSTAGAAVTAGAVAALGGAAALARHQRRRTLARR
jgi:hypothetical protein